MLNRISISLLSVTALILLAMPAQAQQPATQPSGKVYELRIYTCNEGKLPDLHARFRDHSIRILAKHGMESIYYWTISEGTAADGADAKNMLVYVLSHKSREAADKSWEAFRADPEWVAVKAKSEEKGPLLSKTPVSIFMEPTAFNPPDEPVNGKSDASPRLFELRKYNDGEARVPATVDRFAGWEAELFRKHGAQTLGFWTASDKSAFIYLLAYKDKDARAPIWAGFTAEFGTARAAYNARSGQPPATAPAGGARRGGGGGARGGGGGSEVRMLIPTDYSPRK